MALTMALYYPWIEISHEGWLKNAMLYWEKIQTIVPSSIQRPYSTRTSREFYNEGLLVPLHVDSSMPEIEGLTDDVFKYLDSPEGTEVLMAKEFSEHHSIHSSKVPEEIRELVEIHPDKLPDEVQQKIWRTLNNDWITVDSRFAQFYMTLLATRLSDNFGVALLTDAAPFNKLATAARMDGSIPITQSRKYGINFGEVSPAQGILANLILEGFRIDPETPVNKILKFRKDHADELGRFRKAIGELTKDISSNQPPERLRQQVEDAFINEVRPAINSLKKGLTDSTIQWMTKSLLSIATFSPSSIVMHALLGLAVPYALIGVAGLSVTTSAILYNRERAEKLRQNPYSFVFAAKKAFPRKGQLRNQPNRLN